MYPDAGARDRFVTIQQRPTADAVDAGGTPTDEPWTTLTKAYAQKIEVTGRLTRERFEASQLSAPYDTVWRIGYRPDMDPEIVNVPKTRRIVYMDRVHDIIQATMIGRRHGVELATLSGGTVS